MKLPKSLVLAVATAAVAASLPVLVATSAVAVTNPPWEPDPNAAGTITFYDSAGHVVTSGADLSHIADFAAASGGKQDPAVNRATLYFASPDHTQADSSTWTTNSGVATSLFPNNSAPAPITGPAFAKPLVTVGTGGNISAWYGGVTHDSTAGYANVVQVRIVESGPGGVQPAKFWDADIQVDTTAGTWTELYPTAGSTATPTSTALGVLPASPVVAGTSSALTATLTPTGAVGSVTFHDGATSLGTVAVSAGTAVLSGVTLATGSHTLTASFAPTNPGAFSASTSPAVTYVITAAPSSYTAVTPCRVFDTRGGGGRCTTAPTVPVAKVGPGGVLGVKVTGMGGVPADATAVVLNVTAVNATASTFVSVYPAAGTPPTVSNLNVAGAAAVPNLVIVPVGPGGVVDFYNKAGTVDLIADAAGYYSAGAGSLYDATAPCRVFDTRYGVGSCSNGPTTSVAKVGPGGVLKVKVTGVGGVPDNATAVVVNVTALGATVPGTYVSAYPDSPTRPAVSNLNVATANPVPNLTVIPVGPGGLIDFYNHVGSVDLIGDLAGYFAPTGSTYTPTGPCRVFDTRSGNGICPGAPVGIVPKAKVGPASSLKVKVTGVGGVPDNATAVVLNVTAVNATVPGTYVTVYPDPTKPLASNLNVNSSGAIPNLVVVPIGPGGYVDFFNAKGSVDLIADVAGYYSP